MNVFYVGKRTKPFQHWEPIYIGTNEEPLPAVGLLEPLLPVCLAVRPETSVMSEEPLMTPAVCQVPVWRQIQFTTVNEMLRTH